MSTAVIEILSEYGPLGAMVIIFAGVIKSLDTRHQKTIRRIESEKNEQIAELKADLREMKGILTALSGENHVTISQNTVTLERNNCLIDDVRHLLREILERKLDS